MVQSHTVHPDPRVCLRSQRSGLCAAERKLSTNLSITLRTVLSTKLSLYDQQMRNHKSNIQPNLRSQQSKQILPI